MNRDRTRLARTIALGLAALWILSGVALRFTDLASHSYSNDEATTSIRVAGSSLREWLGLFDGTPRTVGDLRKFQTLVPGRSTAHVIETLAVEDPQHPPLYYIAERGWITLFGTTVADRRALSAVFGMLAVAAAFLLGLELGGSLVAGASLAAIVAVSPFQAIYAQQAREYALWSLVVFLSTALLVRGVRRGDFGSWSWYALSAAVGLYTDLLFLLTLIAHFAIVLALDGRRVRTVAWSVGAMAVAGVLFAPWIVVVLQNSETLTNNDFLGASLPLTLSLAKWIFNASTVFVDLEYRNAAALLLIPVVAIALVAFVVILGRRRDLRPALVVSLVLIAITTCAMLGLDHLRHESRSTAGRYLIPAWVGLEVLAGIGIAALIEARGTLRAALGLTAFAFFGAIGLASILADTGGTWTWADSSVAFIRPVMDAVDGAAQPVMIYQGEMDHWDFTAAQLLNGLRDDVRVVLIGPSRSFPGAFAGATTFLLDPTARVLEGVERAGLALDQVYLPDPMFDKITSKLRARARAIRQDAGVADDRTTLWRVVAAPSGTDLGWPRTARPWPASFRPYGKDAFWNRPVPPVAHPRLLPSSELIVSAAEANDNGPELDVFEYNSGYADGRPVVFGSPSDPEVTVQCVTANQCSGAHHFAGKIHLPEDAKPGSNSDAHLTVIEPGGEEIDLFSVRPNGAKDIPKWTTGSTITVGNAVDCGNFFTGEGTTGSGDGAEVGDGCIAAGFVRYGEFLAAIAKNGFLPHALFTLTRCGASDGAFVYPAFQPVDERCSGPNGVPNGAHIWLDLSDAQVNALPLTAWEKVILRTMHHYGAYIMDFGSPGPAHTDSLGKWFPVEGAEQYVPFGTTPPFWTWAQMNGFAPITIKPTGSGTEAGIRYQWPAGTGQWNPLAALGGWNSGHLHVLDPCYARGNC